MATGTGAQQGWSLDETGGPERLFVPWLLFSAACVVWMWVAPGGEVIPFHLIWIVFALAYGFEPWPVRRTLAALGALALVSGGLLAKRAQDGVIAWEETAEIALMLLLAALVLAHVQRRQAALATVTRLAEARVAAARERERLARLTSHEMRTPLTIATGYVDLLLRDGGGKVRRQDLEIVRDELGRLGRAGDRLLRMIRLQDMLDRTAVDLAELITETVDRWGVVADRDWQVEVPAVRLDASPERLRACLDTLIENAVRHTPEGGVVRVFCSQDRDTVLVGVADSGPGFTGDQRRWLNASSGLAHTALHDAGGGPGEGEEIAPGERDEIPPGEHTGFGLGIVREVVEAHHGAVRVGTSREGGALVVVVLPTRVSQPAPRGAVPAQRSAARSTRVW